MLTRCNLTTHKCLRRVRVRTRTTHTHTHTHTHIEQQWRYQDLRRHYLFFVCSSLEPFLFPFLTMSV